MSFRKSIITTLGLNIYTFIIGFFNSIISTRILGADGKGIFAIYTSSIELFVLILGLGIPQALVFFAAKDEITRSRLYYSSFVYITVSSLVFLLIVYFSSWFGIQSFFLPDRFTSPIYILMITVNFFALIGWHFYISILNGHKFFPQTNLVSFLTISVTFVIYIGLLIIPAQEGQYEANTFYAIQLAAAIFTLGTTLYFHRKLVGKVSPELVSSTETTAVIKYGTVYYISSFLLFANSKMDYWFVNYFHGWHELGIYVLASNVALLILLFPNAAGLVLLAFKAKSDVEDIESRTAFLCRLTTFITVLASLALWIIGEFLIVLVYGEDFRQSAYVLRIILLGVIPFSVFTILKNYFAGANELRSFLIASAIGFVLTLLLDVALIKPFGIVGAAVATAIAYFSSAFYLIYVFSKKTGIPILNVILFNRHDYLYTKEMVLGLIKRKS